MHLELTTLFGAIFEYSINGLGIIAFIIDVNSPFDNRSLCDAVADRCLG
ncbi:hypothetical protein GCM10007916_23120 [Psychromonas marina]|uniref:Uncharacterized protein n=1 Tax=Psychromonas marina TaxID=88364 RepID=A0ABQ6E240_9GAMM|nr:hypothetical protein GCM10007916_23120 [Psychromonas marina]